MPQVVRTVEFHAPPSVDWRWLATQQALRRWFSPSLETDLRVGGAERGGHLSSAWIADPDGNLSQLVQEKTWQRGGGMCRWHGTGCRMQSGISRIVGRRRAR